MNRPILHALAPEPEVRKLSDRQHVVAIAGQPVATCENQEHAELVAAGLLMLQTTSCPHPRSAIKLHRETFYDWEYGLTDYVEKFECELCGAEVSEPADAEIYPFASLVS
ncbi:MAG TPA: hypothetical protein VFF68_10080 [Anaerolineaceae bacterium]|nr:hypothetical protein [Anaerolineaceae bacterium]